MATQKFDVLSVPKEDYSDDGLMNLANGIVQQAAEDYEQAFLGYYVDHKPPEQVLPELERWFESEDYSTYTKLDGKRLKKMIKLNALEKMIEAYERALSAGREAKLRILVPMPRHVPNVNEQIPPMLMGGYKKVMAEQLKELKKRHKAIKEDEE